MTPSVRPSVTRIHLLPLLLLQACAPLYHWRTVKLSGEKDPVGTCYVAVQNFSAYAEYSPCRTSESCLFTPAKPPRFCYSLLSLLSNYPEH